jgi:hypothetical protein
LNGGHVLFGRARRSRMCFNRAVNAANLLDKRHVTACPFNNSCYFGASRTVIGPWRHFISVARRLRTAKNKNDRFRDPRVPRSVLLLGHLVDPRNTDRG